MISSAYRCWAVGVCAVFVPWFLRGSFGVEVMPVEFVGTLQTPGVGFQTFYRFADSDTNTVKHYPHTGSAYIRYYWEQLEPEEGRYHFALLDRQLAQARENNQTLEFRIMLMDGVGNRVPQWLTDKIVSPFDWILASPSLNG